MSGQLSNMSADLVWEIVRNNNSYLAKDKRNGGVQFSRDPLNLTNKNGRKNAGFVNEKAIGIQPAAKGGVVVTSKKAGFANKPASSLDVVTFGPQRSTRKTYKAVANQSAKRGYRADLRSAAISRVSAIRRAQGKPRETPEPKLRGKKAKAAAAAAEEA
ncbi:hypothetical protein NLU13_7286 [Sarocladium strictum]|uniref:Ribosomal eL28/Mak16 domain-containing protein n=1 Tax=Sarocladium strictum TaxID=5046 RepID=A0AA39GDQ5_SARSR|nr:hypothetical protein NLU13_7286 [Sarocladium strictum]